MNEDFEGEYVFRLIDHVVDYTGQHLFLGYDLRIGTYSSLKMSFENFDQSLSEGDLIKICKILSVEDIGETETPFRTTLEKMDESELNPIEEAYLRRFEVSHPIRLDEVKSRSPEQLPLQVVVARVQDVKPYESQVYGSVSLEMTAQTTTGVVYNLLSRDLRYKKGDAVAFITRNSFSEKIDDYFQTILGMKMKEDTERYLDSQFVKEKTFEINLIEI